MGLVGDERDIDVLQCDLTRNNLRRKHTLNYLKNTVIIMQFNLQADKLSNALQEAAHPLWFHMQGK